MTQPVHVLPMDIWAHVAFFIPFSELFATFDALYKAGALPDTQTTQSNALLQFCSEHQCDETEHKIHIPSWFICTLETMGFSQEVIEYAAILCNGNSDSIIEFLVNSAGT